MTRLAAGAGAIAACLLAACASSPPMRYYTLTPIDPPSRLSAPADMVPVRLDRVTLASELDRLQLVRRIDATRLQIAELDRWAAPLDEMIRRVLSTDLAARLPGQLVADPNEPSLGERRQSLSVDIQEFYADPGCSVTLRAAWILKPARGQSVRGREETQVPASGGCTGSAALPVQMSQALALLSDRIATAIAGAAPAAGQ